MQLSSLSPLRPRVTLMLLAFVLSACGGGGGSGGGTQTSLSLDRNTLTFSTNDPTRSPSTQQHIEAAASVLRLDPQAIHDD